MRLTWQYMVLFRCVEDPSTVNMEIIECEYKEGETREEAALSLCDELGVDRDLFVACIEVSPSAKAMLSNDGSMVRITNRKEVVAEPKMENHRFWNRWRAA